MNIIESSRAPTVNGLVKPDSKAVHEGRLAENLAALAGLSGGLAALAGFIPGCTGIPNTWWSSLTATTCSTSRRFGSVEGHSSRASHAVDDARLEALLDGRQSRAATAGFLAILSLLFDATWLSQMAGAAVSGNLPPELIASGWPMNPVYVLDLGFVVPLALMPATRLARRERGGAHLAVSFLVFDALLAMTILLMALGAAVAGQPLEAPMVVIFAADALVATALSIRALLPFQMPPRATGELTVALTEGSGPSTCPATAHSEARPLPRVQEAVGHLGGITRLSTIS